jgi:hypothetical protein
VASTPISYDSTTNTFSFSSATVSDEGDHPYTLKVYFVELFSKNKVYSDGILSIESCTGHSISMTPSDANVNEPFFLPDTGI